MSGVSLTVKNGRLVNVLDGSSAPIMGQRRRFLGPSERFSFRDEGRSIKRDAETEPVGRLVAKLPAGIYALAKLDSGEWGVFETSGQADPDALGDDIGTLRRARAGDGPAVKGPPTLAEINAKNSAYWKARGG